MEERDVVIIGAGPAGLACVRALAEQGCDVTIIEKTNRLDGTLRRTRTVWPSGEDSEKLLHRLYNELQDELHVTVYQQTELVELTESLHGYRVKLSNDVEEEVGAIVVATGIREVGGNLFEFEYRWRDRGNFRGPLAFEVKEDVHPFLWRPRCGMRLCSGTKSLRNESSSLCPNLWFFPKCSRKVRKNITSKSSEGLSQVVLRVLRVLCPCDRSASSE